MSRVGSFIWLLYCSSKSGYIYDFKGALYRFQLSRAQLRVLFQSIGQTYEGKTCGKTPEHWEKPSEKPRTIGKPEKKKEERKHGENLVEPMKIC